MKHAVDVIIIGGGIHGASLAYHFAMRGMKALVLEKNVLASGATGRSSGLLRMHYDLELDSRLAWLSFQYYREWSERIGGDCGFTRTGFIQLVKPAYTEQLKANVAMNQRVGIPSFVVTNDDVHRLAPCFACDDFQIAAYEPESGYADPFSATQGFMQAARARGARLLQGCQVVDVLTTDSKVTGVETNQESFSANIVVNAAGAWAAEIGAMVGLDIPVDTWLHETMFTRRPVGLHTAHPSVIDDINTMYFRPETGNLTLVGMEDDNPIGMPPDFGYDYARQGFVDRAADHICRRIPAMEHGSLQSAQTGFDGITLDQRALLGQAGPEGFYLVCGFSGTGFKLAPAVGICMVEWIMDGEAKTVDISPFRLSRFKEGKPLKGEHAYENIWR
jgi:sarcosine oxidase subunit beta